MDWEIIEAAPPDLALEDVVKLKTGLLGKVTGFTRNTSPRIFVLEIIGGFHENEVMKVELSEVEAKVRVFL